MQTWIEAIVMPREDASPQRPAPRRSRQAVYQAAVAEGQQFHESVVGFLRSRRLMGAVRWVSQPGSLPMVTLHCTPPVLEQLKQAPQFEAGCSMPMELQVA